MNTRRVGAHYEEVAARFLQKKGLRVIARNFRHRRGEIDIIARDGAYLVFVEVKYRKNASAGYPEEALSVHKQHQIRQAAFFYCVRFCIPESQAMRFDVIAIDEAGIRHYVNAF